MSPLIFLKAIFINGIQFIHPLLPAMGKKFGLVSFLRRAINRKKNKNLVGETEDSGESTASSPSHQPQLLPPAGRQHRRAASSKLSFSLSMRSLGDDRKLKHEESLWKKTIILGEKCRVPANDDDTILYDENGNRFSSYHRRNAGLSRQTSCVDSDYRENNYRKKMGRSY